MSINSIKRARFDYMKERKGRKKYINRNNGAYKEISSSLANCNVSLLFSAKNI